MTLRQYEYALAVAAEGSVTAAAERLHVAQPSMSQQIRSLERDLGVSLFARTPTGLTPTAVGRAFLREAQVAVNAARRARATARAAADDLGGELLVSVQMGFGTRDSALDAILRQVLQDNELTPITAARVTQTATAVRLAAQGLGTALVPASAVPHEHEHLTRPLFPAVSQPVIAVLRDSVGPAETALLDLLRQETWPQATSLLTASPTAERDAG
ncbi:LysR family transcriptional regulator [Streptomyces sp. NRRL S-813]|uniref:LysR family transcriptional regulator n=1 Tax=Streptomyces sp. NRRL S-813 TaxID=1463919 RepID=UPI00068EF138|nr:LysR family transcriptional regulator [Streptomyces sp. NRRL S-813]